jgi:hypothetical protein
MANEAIVSMQAKVLPDDIAKTISATTSFTPKDTNDKWYYKLTSVSASSTDLMAGNFIDYTAVDDDTAPTAIATGDKVEILFIKNIDSSNDIYVVFDAGTASSTAGDAVKISPNESFFARLPNTTVADVHAIGHDGSSGATATCIVAALLDDVG